MQNGFEKGGRIYYARPYDGDMHRLEDSVFRVLIHQTIPYTQMVTRADVYGIEPFYWLKFERFWMASLILKILKLGDYIIQGGILDDMN